MLPIVKASQCVFFKLLIITALIRYRSYAEIGQNSIPGTLKGLYFCSSVVLRLDCQKAGARGCFDLRCQADLIGQFFFTKVRDRLPLLQDSFMVSPWQSI
jgi:hypothetical protein